MTETTARPESTSTLVGNRWALVGGIIYLLEFVAIIGVTFAGVDSTVTVGSDPETILVTYAGNVDSVAFMAGWFSLVLLGRILFFAGLRDALKASGHRHTLLDFAVVTAAVSVTLEVATYGFAAAAADLAGEGEDSLVVLLDQAGAWVNMLLLGGLGVAVTAAAWCMWRTGLFSTALNVIGLVAGLGMAASQLLLAPTLGPVLGVVAWTPLLWWVWMIWTGVVLWRRAPARTS